jgi:hypothetical protein
VSPTPHPNERLIGWKLPHHTARAEGPALMISKPLPHFTLDHVIGHRPGPLGRESMRGHQLRLKLRVSADRLSVHPPQEPAAPTGQVARNGSGAEAGQKPTLDDAPLARSPERQESANERQRQP